MSEDLNAVASDATAEAAAPVIETNGGEPAAPPISARDALEKAFRTVDDQPRAPDGKWTKDGEGAAKPALEPVAKEAAPPGAAVAPPPAPETPPPSAVPAPTRLSKDAQAAWSQTPEPVRAEVDRAFREMQAGIEQYQSKWEPFKQFDAMAQQAGRELHSVLAEYVQTENVLRADPVKGFAALCQRMGIDPAQMGAALQGVQSQGGASPQEGQLLARIADLEARLNQTAQTFQQQQLQAQIADFSKDKPRFEELKPLMAEMLETGFATDLTDAYAKAERLQPPPPVVAPPKPAIPAATIPANPPAQTRRPSLQITGSPSASDATIKTPAGSAREALARSFEAVGLR